MKYACHLRAKGVNSFPIGAHKIGKRVKRHQLWALLLDNT